VARVNEVKGRALGLTAVRLLLASLGLLVLGSAAGMLSPFAGMVLCRLGEVLWCGAVTDTVVFLTWNAGAGLWRGAPRYREVLRRAEYTREILRDSPAAMKGMPHHQVVNPGGTRLSEPYAAIRQAVQGGTFSMNGVRYPPDPAALAGGGTFTRPLPDGRISKSECDGCGDLLDVAWCTPGTFYFCRPCRENGAALRNKIFFP
jgi:hypothetical protein